MFIFFLEQLFRRVAAALPGMETTDNKNPGDSILFQYSVKRQTVYIKSLKHPFNLFATYSFTGKLCFALYFHVLFVVKSQSTLASELTLFRVTSDIILQVSYRFIDGCFTQYYQCADEVLKNDLEISSGFSKFFVETKLSCMTS